MDTSLQGLFDAMAAKGMQSVPMDHAAKILLCILRALSHLQDRVINGEVGASKLCFLFSRSYHFEFSLAV